MTINHIFSMTAIAAITSVTTVTLTHRLLSRPWCMDFQANGQPHIIYGQHECLRNRTSQSPYP
ncbi:MAG: hypothetical protein AAGD25_07920 [Cyanobacteria bacterium P01_F01_bin.150]